jgi:hypothetical protein
MRRLLIAGTEVQAEAGELAERLAEAFASREPLCLCCPDGVPMYVARAAEGCLDSARHGHSFGRRSACFARKSLTAST